MKHLLGIILCLYLCTNLGAQVKSSLEISTGAWNSFRHLLSEWECDPRNRKQNIAGVRLLNPKSINRGSIGLGYNQRISERVTVGLGVYWRAIGYDQGSIGDTVLMSPDCFPTCPDSRSFDIPARSSSISSNRYVDIPLSVRWHMSTGRWSTYIKGSVGFSIYQNTRWIIELDSSTDDIIGESNSTLNGGSKFNTSVSVGLGHKIGPRIEIFGQPTFLYYLTKTRRTFSLDRYFAIGLELGMRFTN